MRNLIEIENIDEMRRREGIDDVELREGIRALHVGDFVRLTFLAVTKPFAPETLSVRITSIRGKAFRGKLADRPASSGLSGLRIGTSVTFTRDHIHSILNERSSQGVGRPSSASSRSVPGGARRRTGSLLR
jgi:hypothetical protein